MNVSTADAVIEETVQHCHVFCATILTYNGGTSGPVGIAARRLAHYTKMRLIDGIPSYEKWEIYVAAAQAIERANSQEDSHVTSSDHT